MTAAPPPLEREWLVTNGLGGYASGSVAGVPTRKHHGWLVAALPDPLGRVVALSHLDVELHVPGSEPARLTGIETLAGGLSGPDASVELHLEDGLPVWRHEARGVVVEQRVLMPAGANATHVSFRLVEGPDAGVRLLVRPSLAPRPHEGPVSVPVVPLEVAVEGTTVELRPDGLPPLRLAVVGAGAFVPGARTTSGVRHRVEADRGYESVGDLWSPGAFSLELGDEPVTLVASIGEGSDVAPDEAARAERARRRALVAAAPDLPAPLVLAADAFVIDRSGFRTVIAGYHWFTDWGRDTMISLEGLCLLTGRHADAAAILRRFATAERDGLIPNLFPEGRAEGLYHTADATLWFVHAVSRYEELTGDAELVRELLPTLVSVVEHHVAGTRFGIGADPADGLLRAGAPGLQLTWMDAKVDDWVVTPRRGKPVEINALWYQALRLVQRWAAREVGADLAATVEASFDRRFWSDLHGHLLDVVDGEAGDDPALRPNQLLAVSLPLPVARPERWRPVVDAVRDHLLTPVGLRTLAAGEPGYRARYDGDLRSRDGAYHQGTVWPWLAGPYVDAWRRAHPERAGEARRALDGLWAHLDEAGVGSVSEIFDAEAPHVPRGCVAQAWSVAELLRATAALDRA